MARTHAKMKCELLQHEGFPLLDADGQAAWQIIMIQPKLSLVGCVDYMPARWATHTAGMTEARFDAAVWQLEQHGFVVVDEDTHELLVRTFVKHDGVASANENLRRGVWSAWRAIASKRLRKVAVDNMPDSLFEPWQPKNPAKPGNPVEIPAEALEMRCSERMETPLRTPVATPVATNLPPFTATTCTVTPSERASGSASTPIEPLEDEGEEGGLVSRTVRAVAHRELAAKKARGERIFSDSGFVSWWLQENGDGCAVRVLEILRDFEGLSDSQLADLACSHQAPAWAKQYRRDNHLRVVESEPA